MPLTLKIISKQRHILGADSTHVFSVHGGTVGRAPDNDWVLPDPDRYISAHHANFDYRSGAYFLTDTSTNGVFVNDSDQPVGKGTPLRLYDGDRLRMGDYQFEVSIVNVSRDGADDRGDAVASDEEKAAEAVSRARAARAAKAGQSAGPASLKLLTDEADAMASDAELAAAEHHPTDTVTYPDGEPSEEALNSTFADTGVIDEDFFRAQSAAPEGDPERAPLRQPAPASGDLSEAVRLLMEASGLDASRLPPGSDHETLVTVGHLVRTTVEGLLSVLRSRALIKGQFRLTQTTIQSGDNNPLKFVPGVQDALEQLFYRPTTEFLRPVEAVDDAFRDVRAHQVATVVAMKAAFHDLLERLEPDVLEERFDRGLKRGGLFPGGKQAKYWELYRDLFQVIAGHTDENFANIVGPKFAEAYDKEIYRLTGRGLPPRRMVDS